MPRGPHWYTSVHCYLKLALYQASFPVQRLYLCTRFAFSSLLLGARVPRHALATTGSTLSTRMLEFSVVRSDFSLLHFTLLFSHENVLPSGVIGVGFPAPDLSVAARGPCE